MGLFKKIIQLLTLRQKYTLVIQFILIIIGMGLEMAGMGLLLPAINIMSQDGQSLQSPFLAKVISYFGNPSKQELLIGVLCLLIFTYLIKMIYLGYLSWRQNGYIYGIRSHLSQKLYGEYLRKPYVFHLQRNSAILINNVMTVVNQFCSSLMALFDCITEIFMLTGIVILLLLIEPSGTIIVFSILGTASFIFYRLTKNKLTRWGKDLNVHEGMRIQHLQQGLGGIKEVKISGKEIEFLSKYQYHNEGSAKVNRRYMTLQTLPRLWLEFLAVIGIFTLIGIMLIQGISVDLIAPKLGIFVAAAFRLIPSINKILSSMQNIRYTKTPLSILLNEFESHNNSNYLNDNKPLSFSFDNLVLNKVSFNYPNAEEKSLREISLAIKKGETVGFIGTTGAGKSTLVDIILGLLIPGDGTVKVDNSDIHINIRSWQKQIGYVPQFIFLTDDSLRNNVAFGIPNDQINEEAVWRAIRLAQLEDFVKELPDGLNTNVGERGVRLSGGQRQRVGIARALYHDPSVIVLDEATSSLDAETENSVMESVRALHGTKTILIIAHRYSTIQHCDTIYRLDRGSIIQKGNPVELLN